MQPIDNQPIAATFFGEGKWLSDFITPEAIDVKELHSHIIGDSSATSEDTIAGLRRWVASQIQYKRFIKGRIWIEGKVSTQDDLWNLPSVTSRVGVGNCANKSFLLASLIRQELLPNQVYCVLGNLYNGKPGGHAWIQVRLHGADYIVESTREAVPDFVPVTAAERYEAVHLFNDKEIYSIEGKTVMEPYTACYSTWLEDYLSWSYIESKRGQSRVY